MTPASHILPDLRTRVETWDTLEERPTGSRDKVTVSDPDTHTLMIFKRPKPGREHQTWSELLGSYIAGDMLGWPVQRTGLGVRRGQPGNLLAYFFDPDSGERLVEGWRLCLDAKPDFDDRVGTDHSLALLRTIVETGGLERYGVEAAAFWRYWARAIAFDTLISNTDRHAENWGIVESAGGNRIAPLYDNATSLGCGIDGTGLARYFEGGRLDTARIEEFARKGRHHLRLDGRQKRGTPFVVLGRAFLDAFPGPEMRAPFERVADLDLDPARAMLETLSSRGFPEASRDHAARRVAHVHAILLAGRSRVRAVLER